MPLGTLALLPVLSIAVLAYRQAKAYPFVKALLVPLVWTWAGLALPLADGSWLGWRSLAHPVALPLFLLLAAGCLLCDVNDADRDRASGVRSLPVQVGVGRTLQLAALLAALGTAAGLAQGRLGLVVDGLLLAALSACRPLLMLESWGPLAVDLVLTLPGVLILAHLV
jgi:4-hydroxybenzoate polyprenyltransferase